MEADILFVPVEVSDDAAAFVRNAGKFTWNSRVVLAARFGTSLMGVGVDIPVLLQGISFRGKV